MPPGLSGGTGLRGECAGNSGPHLPARQNTRHCKRMHANRAQRPRGAPLAKLGRGLGCKRLQRSTPRSRGQTGRSRPAVSNTAQRTAKNQEDSGEGEASMEPFNGSVRLSPLDYSTGNAAQTAPAVSISTTLGCRLRQGRTGRGGGRHGGGRASGRWRPHASGPDRADRVSISGIRGP